MLCCVVVCLCALVLGLGALVFRIVFVAVGGVVVVVSCCGCALVLSGVVAHMGPTPTCTDHPPWGFEQAHVLRITGSSLCALVLDPLGFDPLSLCSGP